MEKWSLFFCFTFRQDDNMHLIIGTTMVSIGNQVADKRFMFGQIRREIHFFPLAHFPQIFDAWVPKLPQVPPPYEVDLAVYRTRVDRAWMLSEVVSVLCRVLKTVSLVVFEKEGVFWTCQIALTCWEIQETVRIYNCACLRSSIQRP